MASIDLETFKRVISAAKIPPPQPMPASLAKNRRTAGKMLDSVLAKAGLDTGKLTKMLAQDRDEQHRYLQKQKADAAKHFPAAEAVYRQRIQARQEALGLLSKPFLSTLITLDRPFFIWQLPNPQLNIFIDEHAESMNSSIKILVDTNSGSDNTRFVFYFLWVNDSDFLAVVNATSSLVFNGSCEADAAPGIFSGDTADLNLTASLTTMRWSGWGNDPVTGTNNNQTPYPGFSAPQSVAALHAQGGHIFGDQDVQSKVFSFQPFDLSENMIAVPGKAVVVFEVALQLSYGFDDGGNISDAIRVDFANNGNSVRCPFVLLELLTAPSNVAAA